MQTDAHGPLLRTILSAALIVSAALLVVLALFFVAFEVVPYPWIAGAFLAALSAWAGGRGIEMEALGANHPWFNRQALLYGSALLMLFVAALSA